MGVAANVIGGQSPPIADAQTTDQPGKQNFVPQGTRTDISSGSLNSETINNPLFGKKHRNIGYDHPATETSVLRSICREHRTHCEGSGTF